jgi:hypothetical protein
VIEELSRPRFMRIAVVRAGTNTSVPQPGTPSRFLNRDFTDSGIRTMWVQVKLLF